MTFSVTEPSPRQKWGAGILVVTYALVTMLPLLWIIATGFKSSADSIAYPPKIVFDPTVEGYVNVFTAQTRLSKEQANEPREDMPWYEQLVRNKGNTIVGPSRFFRAVLQLRNHWLRFDFLRHCSRYRGCLCFFAIQGATEG